MFRENNNSTRAFTLIELLVVIAIIGVLSSVVLVSLNSVREKARDARRMNDLRELKIALELYYNKFSRYPIISSWATSESTTYDPSSTSWNNLESLLSEFISKLPGDPSPKGTSGPWTTNNYHYAYLSRDGVRYDLVAQLENKNSQNTCQNKCWLYHQSEGITIPPESSWCGACSGGWTFSPYIYADH